MGKFLHSRFFRSSIDERMADLEHKAGRFLGCGWAKEFTAKLSCNVELWIERLAKLAGLEESIAN